MRMRLSTVSRASQCNLVELDVCSKACRLLDEVAFFVPQVVPPLVNSLLCRMNWDLAQAKRGLISMLPQNASPRLLKRVAMMLSRLLLEGVLDIDVRVVLEDAPNASPLGLSCWLNLTMVRNRERHACCLVQIHLVPLAKSADGCDHK